MGRDTTFIVYIDIPHNPKKDCYNLEFENATYDHYTHISDKYFERYHYDYIIHITEKVCPKCLFVKFFDDSEVYDIIRKTPTTSDDTEIRCPIIEEINVHHCYTNSILRSSWYIDNVVQSEVCHNVCKEFNVKSFIDTLIYFQKKGKPTNVILSSDDGDVIDDEAAYEETFDILLRLQKYFIDDDRNIRVLYCPEEI